MKNLILFLFILLSFDNFLSGQDCYPNSDGYYKYYVHLDTTKIDSMFDKYEFTQFLKNSRAPDFNKLVKSIEKVEKSFPSSRTPYLQSSISLYSKNGNLESILYEANGKIDLVEKVCFPEESLSYEPNDFYYNGNKSTQLELVNIDEAFDISDGDSRVIIGVTDTYLDVSHEDLVNKVVSVLQNSNSNSSLAYHGTRVVGVLGAETNNGIGISSSGGNSSILFSSNWANTNEVLEIAQIPGVRVINCSWINSCNYLTHEEMVFQEIRDIHNVVVVAGAGNKCEHCGCNAYVYPASYESVISVTSVGHISDYGFVSPNYGANNWKDCHEEVIGDESWNHHHNDKVNICAPGYNITTTISNNNYGSEWGTSFAAPIVSGICGLVIAENPCLSAKEVQDIILITADPNIYMLECNQAYIGQLGTGRIDAFQAVKRAKELRTEYIQNTIINSVVLFESETDIQCGYNVTNDLPYGLVSLLDGADVEFIATDDIILSSGFQVLPGATATFTISDSDCY